MMRTKMKLEVEFKLEYRNLRRRKEITIGI